MSSIGGLSLFVNEDDVVKLTLGLPIPGGGTTVLGSDEVTDEELTFTVDYNGGAVADTGDVTPGVKFTTQDQIDSFLSTGSWTGFKNLMDVIEALPIIAHKVTINVAAGKQRPRSTDTTYAWDLSGLLFIEKGFLEVTGSAPSTWTVVSGLSSLTVDSFTGATSTDPRLEFGTSQTTPFAALDLRALPVVMDTGQVIMIHDHDDDTLICCENASPTPSTATVARPSTEFVNSLNDSTAVAANAAFRVRVQGIKNSGVGGHIDFTNIMFNTAGVIGMLASETTVAGVDQCLVDYTVGVINNGRAFQFADPTTRLEMQRSGVKSTPGAGSADEPIFAFVGAEVDLEGCAFYGTRDGISVQDAPLLAMANTVIRECGPLSGWALNIENTNHFLTDRTFFLQGCNVRIDDQQLRFFGQETKPIFTSFQRIAVGGVSGAPAVLVDGGARIDFSGAFFTSEGLKQGVNANSDVGLEVPATAARSTVELNADTDVTGSVDDFRFAGVTDSYTNLVTTGRRSDVKFNTLEKLP